MSEWPICINILHRNNPFINIESCLLKKKKKFNLCIRIIDYWIDYIKFH